MHFSILLNWKKKLLCSFQKIAVVIAMLILNSVHLSAQDVLTKQVDPPANLTPCVFTIADTITGNKEACFFITTLGGDAAYSIVSSGATSYSWSVSNATTMQIISGQGTSSIQIHFSGSYGIGSVSVAVTNDCGPSVTRTANIFNGPPPIPGVISGDPTACPYINYDTTAVYKIDKVINATSYLWTVPQGMTIIGRPGGTGTSNDTIIIVKFDNSFVNSTFITVNAVSGCGVSSPKNFTIHRSTAPVPGYILGSVNSCPLKIGTYNATGTPAVYKIDKVRYAVSYIWKVPAGVTIISPIAGTSISTQDTSITVRFSSSFSGGNIAVQSVTGCGISPERILFVNDQLLSTPPPITGTVNPCPTINGPDTTSYRIRKVDDAILYNWTVPAGATIVGHPGGAGTVNDTIILVRWTPAFTTGNIEVNCINNCSVSWPRKLSIVARMPGSPSVISWGLVNACPYRQYGYMITDIPPNTNSLVWTVPNGATILGGQGSTVIKVEYSSAAITGTVSVYGVNNCGIGPIRSLPISLPACSSGRSINTENKSVVQENNAVEIESATEIYPNPSSGYFTLKLHGFNKEKIQLTILSIPGIVLDRKNISANDSLNFGNDLHPGMYVVQIRQGSKMITRKIIKL